MKRKSVDILSENFDILNRSVVSCLILFTSRIHIIINLQK